MNKKIYGIILILLLLGVGLGGYIYIEKDKVFWQQVEELEGPLSEKDDINKIDTSDWLIYQNEKFRYEINYPREAVVSGSTNERGLEIIVNSNYKISNPDWENQQLIARGIGLDGGLGLRIFINNPIDFKPVEYTTPCEWFYAVSEKRKVIVNYDLDTCKKVSSKFNGESAYIYERDSNGLEDGIYAMKDYIIVFAHEGNIWEIGYNAPPTNPTEEWKNHLQYKYLKQSVPIIKAIVNSFRFID